MAKTHHPESVLHVQEQRKGCDEGVIYQEESGTKMWSGKDS